MQRAWQAETAKIHKQDAAFASHITSMAASLTKTFKTIQVSDIENQQAVSFFLQPS